MTQLIGADSEEALVAHVDVLGFYPDTWTRGQVAASGARGCLPIKVPSSKDPWWESGVFAAPLVDEALDWGVPLGSPLCIDIEEDWAEQMTSAQAKAVVQVWHDTCHAAGLHPWIYSGETLFIYTITTTCNRWLASWPDVVPARPTVPPGYSGWQYASGGAGPDRDVFMPGVYMRPDASGVVLLGITQEVEMPVLITLTDPENAPGQNPYWLLDDTASVIAEGAGDLAELQQKLPAANQWKVSYSLIKDRVLSSIPQSSPADETEPADNPAPQADEVAVAAPAEDDGPPAPPPDVPSEAVQEPPATGSSPEAPSPLPEATDGGTFVGSVSLTPAQESALRSAGLL